jgi:hypothetical protein
MPHRVHAAVDPVKPPPTCPPFDRAIAYAQLVQLPPLHDAVLAPGERGDPAIRRGLGEFSIYMNGKSPSPPLRPPQGVT